MKRLILFVLIVLASTAGFAQQGMQTLISGDIEHGGFGGPVIRMGEIGNQTAIFIGGRGGWIINHALVLGAGGYGLVTEVESTPDKRLEMGYGGMELGFVLGSNSLLHLAAQTLIGGGCVTEHDREIFPVETEDWEHYPFFVLEPGVDVELNVAPFMRIAGGVSYRYISGIDVPGFVDEDFSGVGGVITFKFGKF